LTGDIIYELGGKEKLEEAYKNNLQWIINSFIANDYQGSSTYSNVFGNFSSPYLETTGYLIPTLIEATDYFSDIRYSDIAYRQISFFKKYQNPNGSFYQSIDNPEPIVFDSSQILLGLCKLYESKQSEALQAMISGCTLWLYALLDSNGAFTNYNYGNHTSPSYYSRIYWPMLLGKKIIGDNEVDKIITGLDRVTGSQHENYSFPNWSFDENESALTHTIAYTLRGLLECGQLLKSDDITKSAQNTIHKIAQLIIRKGAVSATYDYDWQSKDNYTCAAGNAQLAILMLRSELSVELKNRALRILLKPLLDRQKKSGANKGAISSSIPIWGKYQRFKYTNWTQKFFADALYMLLLDQ